MKHMRVLYGLQCFMRTLKGLIRPLMGAFMPWLALLVLGLPWAPVSPFQSITLVTATVAYCFFLQMRTAGVRILVSVCEF